jgi:hypothetical protein
MESARLSPGQTVDGFLLVRGDFSCGAGCRFEHPLYVAGNCDIGKGSVLETVEADGGLHLGPAVEVQRTAGCEAELNIRAGCRVDGIAYSRTSIHLGLGVAVKELYAPEVSTPGGAAPDPVRSSVNGRRATEMPVPGRALNRGTLQVTGIDPRRLRVLAPDTWVYVGDLYLEQPVVFHSNLIVDGAFSTQPGSLFEGQVETAGTLALGDDSVALGNLSAGGDLILGRRCIFQGDLLSDQLLRLGAGARGVGRGRPVKVASAGELAMEEDVAVRGRLTSNCRVVSEAAEQRVLPRGRVIGGLG